MAACPLFGPDLSPEVWDVLLLLNLKRRGAPINRAERIMGLRRGDKGQSREEDEMAS